MKRLVWILAIAAIAITAGVSLIALPHNVEWTTSSTEALDAFNSAMEASDKFYHWDSVQLCKKALEFDPDFVAAKILLSSMLSDFEPEQAKLLRDEAVNADLNKLKPRERLMIERIIAYRADQPENAREILETYLEEYPDDSYALSTKAGILFHEGELEEAERLYNRIVEVNPNAVLPYNQLGYIAMQMGRFAEAEEHFTSYRFIAPDQANPHDSLGELFIITGRYQEAIESFERAISIKSDFWNSHVHLIIVHVLLGDFDLAQQAIDRARETDAMPEKSIEAMQCSADSWRLFKLQAWHDVINSFESDASCMSNPMSVDSTILTVHRAACVAGQFGLAAELEEKVKAWTDKKTSKKSKGRITPTLQHMTGVRRASQNEFETAAELFKEVDSGLRYRNADEGLFKLINRLMLVEVLLADDQQAEAHTLLSQVRMVNPTMVADFEEKELQILSLHHN